MTTALPSQSTALNPTLDVRHLRLVGTTAHGGGGQGTAPLDGYLVLVPAGTDPAEIFTAGGAPPEIRPVTYPATIPAPLGASDAVRIDPTARVARVGGQELDLTFLEFELLAHLVTHPGRVHTREQLVASIWGYHHVGDGRTVDVHIARLRRKLGAAHRHRIVTVRRAGYKYVPDEQPGPDRSSTG
jgi:DNA-binding winged helix-turn-helix (wHTH) protein